MKHLFFGSAVVAVVSTVSCALGLPQEFSAPQVPSTQPATSGNSAAEGTDAAADQTDAATNQATGGYLIGPDDVLSIVFWRDKELSGEAVVRPDGLITLPLLNDIQAAGRTPEQLRVHLIEKASKFVEDPAATVLVKQINSRKVFITGNISNPGIYPLTGTMTILQLIAVAGGLPEFADSENILIMRSDMGKSSQFRFNYKDVTQGKRVEQNIALKPGDTVVVP